MMRLQRYEKSARRRNQKISTAPRCCYLISLHPSYRRGLQEAKYKVRKGLYRRGNGHGGDSANPVGICLVAEVDDAATHADEPRVGR